MNNALAWVSYIGKFIVAVVGAVVISVDAALSDGIFTSDEWFPIVVAAITAVGVFLTKNGEKPT